MLLRISGTNRAVRAQADTASHLQGLAGVNISGIVGINGVANVAVAGTSQPVLCEAGLTISPGDTLYVSASVAGRATNVAPTTSVAVGIVEDTGPYVTTGRVYATVTILAGTTSGSGTDTITGLDTSFMPASNLFAYDGPLSTALPTDNMYPRAALPVGFWVDGRLLTGTFRATVKCTTAGGKPANGAALYVAGAIDDANTGAGKVTATPPSITTPFSGIAPTDWARSVNQIAVCLDNSLYDTAKTVIAQVTIPRPIETSTLADQYWTGSEFASLGNTNYFKATGNANVGMKWQIGSTIAVVFSVTDQNQFAGGPTLLSNLDAGVTKGWEICVSGGVLQVRQFSGLGNTFLSFSNVPYPGLNFIVATIVDDGANGQIRACWGSLPRPFFLAGTEFKTATIANPIVDPDATCSYRLGGPLLAGVDGWKPGGIFATGKLLRVASDAEMQQWARNVFPATPGPNRYDLPLDFEQDDLLEFYVRARDWAGGAAVLSASGGPAGTGFAFTTVGAPTLNGRSETWFKNTEGLYLDTEPAARDTRGGVHTDPLARIAFATVPLTQEICVGVRCDNADNSDNDNVVVNTDGILTAFPGTGVASRADDQVRYFWFAIFGASTVIAAHDVEVLVGDKITYNEHSLYRAGSFIESIVAGGAQAFVGPAVARRLLIVGDDVPIGHDAGAACTPVVSWLRADYPGRVTCHAATVRQISGMLQTFGGSMGPWARGIIEAALEGSPTTVDLYFELGFRDYIIPGVTLAAFSAGYAALIDAVRSLTLTFPGVTWNLFLQNLIQDDYDAIPNVDGDTVADYNIELTAIAAARPWLTFVDARVPNAIAWTAAPGVYPSITAGQQAWKANIKLGIGY